MSSVISIDVEGDFGTDSLRGVDEVLPRLLDGFDQRGMKAVLFVVGKVAQARAALIRNAAERGHVIGSHSMTHAIFSRIDRPQRHAEIADSRRAIEDVTGRACDAFRVPYFDATEDLGALLQEAGYRWSSSKAAFSPIAHYRSRRDAKHPHRLRDSTVVELPVSSVLGLPMPEGLSYHRLFWPLPAFSKRAPSMFYLHPYELLSDASSYGHSRWLRSLFTFRLGEWSQRYLWQRIDGWQREGATFEPPSPEALACVT
ncbi:MAG: polysaccharide deacetylase family protein [Polyangiales bacterium]